jgi:hypothetical protein
MSNLFIPKHFRGLLLQGDALDLRYERTAPGAPSASLGHRAVSRCRNTTISAVHESGDTPSLTASRHLRSTPQMSLCRPVVRLPPNAAFFEAMFWCSALQNLATRQPLHVSIGVFSPRFCPHPAQVSRPRCTRHERCSLRCASAASSWPA